MAETSWPFDPQDTTETQYSYIFRNLASTGVLSDVSTSVLRPYGDSSGMNVKVPIGMAFVRGHMYFNDSVKTLTIAAASASPRIDRIVARLNPTTDSIIATVIQGTPASSPALPALQQTDSGVWDLPLATVNVGASVSTIAASAVVDARLFSSAPFGKWTTAGRPTAPLRGDAGFNLSTGLPEYWTGSAWKTFTVTSFTASQITDQQNINAGRISGRKITVSNTGAPASAAVGDVWVDWS